MLHILCQKTLACTNTHTSKTKNTRLSKVQTSWSLPNCMERALWYMSQQGEFMSIDTSTHTRMHTHMHTCVHIKIGPLRGPYHLVLPACWEELCEI